MIRSKGVSQTQQAAKILVGNYSSSIFFRRLTFQEHLKWKYLLDNEKIPPQSASSKPLCMEPFKTIFTTERQPELEIDRLVLVKPRETVVVLVNNQFYLLEYTHK